MIGFFENFPSGLNMCGKGPFVIVFTSTVINEISLCYIYISFWFG